MTKSEDFRRVVRMAGLEPSEIAQPSVRAAGRAFGLPGHARLSFAYGDAGLDAGVDRVSEFVNGA